MPKRDQIINNLREYSATEIVQAIKCGEVTMYELSKSGKLTPLMRKRIEEQLENSSVDETPTQIKEPETTQEVVVEPQTPKISVVEELLDEESSSVPEIPTPNIVIPNTVIKETEINTEILDNKGMFKRPFSFKGRIRRTEFGLSYIIYLVWYIIFISITGMNDINPVVALIAILSIVPAFWFSLAQGTKRCHDRGNSGWYQIIPFYGLVMLFGGSEDGVNNYGTNPKE